jgi:hypothetical protein
MSQLVLLNAARFKGRVTPDVAAACAGISAEAAQAQLDELVGAGLAREIKGFVMLTPEGVQRRDALIAEERAGVDQASLEEAYREFEVINDEMKALVTSWQMKDGDTPNDHSDEAYDAGIVEQLKDLHARFTPLLERFVALAPRLSPYPTRFRKALDQVEGGDRSFIAKPIADSYHTVWFEFHEELFGLLGRARSE